MRIATFNLQNLRLRSRDGLPALDGAVDRDMPEVPRSPALDLADRVQTARVIAAANADFLALQEVFDIEALEFFHDRFLVPAGVAPYPHRICLPGNDGRGLNVAALGRIEPVTVRSHAALTGGDLGLNDLTPDLRENRLFRRDCLRLDLPGLSLFVCHLKAPYPDPEKAWAVRHAEARGVRAVIEAAFERPEAARWIALGDFNEPARLSGEPSALAPLKDGFAVDLMDRLPRGADWTYETPDTHAHSRPDRIFASAALARAFPDALPQVLRSGMGPVHGPGARPHASDHALVYIDFPGLSSA
jgi:hypothetical protein